MHERLDSNTIFFEYRLRVRSILINKLPSILAASILLAAPAAEAQQYVPSFGVPLDMSTRRAQDRVEELYNEKVFDRAFIIYRNELSPIGDKYAQYMVGFMHLRGEGTLEDPMLGSAWFRLAAERNTKQFVLVRDEVLSGMSEVDLLLSDHYFLELRREYSDAVLLLELIRGDLVRLGQQTGTRLSGGASSVTVVDPRGGASVSGDEYLRRVRARIEKRLRYMAKLIGDDTIAVDAEDADIDRIARLVGEYVEIIDDR